MMIGSGFEKFKHDMYKSKSALTLFERMSYDGNYSTVICSPQTGRTHQIRKHLALLGFPIINDPLYGEPKFVDLSNLINQGITVESLPIIESLYNDIYSTSHEAGLEKLTGEFCSECGIRLYKEQIQPELLLHAWKYGATDGSWNYQSSLPDWCVIEND